MDELKDRLNEINNIPHITQTDLFNYKKDIISQAKEHISIYVTSNEIKLIKIDKEFKEFKLKIYEELIKLKEVKQ